MHCVVSWYCTIELENTHIPERRELLYCWHPWFGRTVYVFGAVDKLGEAVFRCNLTGRGSDRRLEVPVWMFDHAACAACIQRADAHVLIGTLLDLARLLADRAANSDSSRSLGPVLDSDPEIRSLANAAQDEDDPAGAVSRTTTRYGCSNAALVEPSGEHPIRADQDDGPTDLGVRRQNAR